MRLCQRRNIRCGTRGFRRSGSCDFASQSSSLRSSANLTPSAQANPATEQCEVPNARLFHTSCWDFGIIIMSFPEQSSGLVAEAAVDL